MAPPTVSVDAGNIDLEAGPRDAGVEAAPNDVGAPHPEAAADVISTIPDAGPDMQLVDAIVETDAADAADDQNIDDAGTADALNDASAEAASDSGLADSAADADAAPVDAGPPQCAVKIFGDYYTRTDGTVVHMGGSQHVVMNATTNQPLQSVVSVTPQADHACALLADQTVWCWSTQTNAGNDNGDLGNGTIGGPTTAWMATQVVTQPADAGAAHLTNVIALDETSTSYYTKPMCAIRADKTVWCWGVTGGSGGGPVGVFWGTRGSAASVPYAFPIASGPTPEGGAQPLIHADQISVGDDALCYLTAGKVYCLGGDVAGNLGDDSNDSHSTGNFQPYPVAVVLANGLPATIESLASGYRFTCALGGGGVWCWGTDSWKQMGNPGAPTQFCNSNYCQAKPVPVQVALADGGLNQSPLGNVTAITAGYQFACALDTAGAIRCWGAHVGGVNAWPEATLYTVGGVPAANVARITASAEQGDINQGVRFLTQAGVLVSRQSVVSQICP